MTGQGKRAAAEGLNTVTPHLVITGAEDAIAFYQRAFGVRHKSRRVERQLCATRLRREVSHVGKSEAGSRWIPQRHP